MPRGEGKQLKGPVTHRWKDGPVSKVRSVQSGALYHDQYGAWGRVQQLAGVEESVRHMRGKRDHWDMASLVARMSPRLVRHRIRESREMPGFRGRRIVVRPGRSRLGGRTA